MYACVHHSLSCIPSARCFSSQPFAQHVAPCACPLLKAVWHPLDKRASPQHSCMTEVDEEGSDTPRRPRFDPLHPPTHRVSHSTSCTHACACMQVSVLLIVMLPVYFTTRNSDERQTESRTWPQGGPSFSPSCLHVHCLHRVPHSNMMVPWGVWSTSTP